MDETDYAIFPPETSNRGINGIWPTLEATCDEAIEYFREIGYSTDSELVTAMTQDGRIIAYRSVKWPLQTRKQERSGD